MQGRGRGSYLGLMLESGLGKSLVGSIADRSNINIKQTLNESAKNDSLRDYDETKVSQTVAVNGVELLDSSPKCGHSTWTSLDLLGNRGRKAGRLSKDVPYEMASKGKMGESEPDRFSPLQDIDSAIVNVSPRKTPSPIGSMNTPSFLFPATTAIGHTVSPTNIPPPKTKRPSPVRADRQLILNNITTPPKLVPSPIKTDSLNHHQVSPSLLPDAYVVAKQVHLSSPQEFMSSPNINYDENIDTASESSTTSTSGSSLYIPPHKRRGYDEKPAENYDYGTYESRKVETKQTWRNEPRIPVEAVKTETAVESELNWQKWKLQRKFKKILDNLTQDNVVGIAGDIKEIIGDSQLSTKFPGVSEVNVIIELLVGRVLDKKESVEISVHVCRLLNAMYPDEFPSNLREVIKEFRQDVFAGVANKNVRCDNFCLLLGKLCDVGKLETKSFQDSLKQCVVGCLYEWILPYQKVDEDSTEAKLKVMYLCELLELTKNVLAFIKRSWVKSCFGKIKNCLLSDTLPRDIRESLLDAVLRHSLQPAVNNQTTNDENSSGDNSRSAAEPSNDIKGDSDLYRDVKKMLSQLELGNLLEKFHDNLIRDSLLRVEKNELKSTLQEAGFAPGAILEIQLYLEKNDSCLNSNATDTSTSNGTSQHSPLLDYDSRVKKMEWNLQQLLRVQEADRKKTRKSERETSLSKPAEQVQPVELEEAKNELLNIQVTLNQRTVPFPAFPAACRPPPGFLNVGAQHRTGCPSPTSVKEALKPEEWPALGSLAGLAGGKEQMPKREVFLERQNPEGTQDKAERSSGKNIKGNSLSKHKGKGRGRRDSRGSLATSMSRYPAEEQKEGNADVSSARVDFGSESPDNSRPFGSSMPIGCFICGSKTHRSAYCTNNKAMFD